MHIRFYNRSRPRAQPRAQKFLGRVVPSGSSATLSKSRRRKRGGAAAAERVPPSTPEELERARRGEYDFYAGQGAAPEE